MRRREWLAVALVIGGGIVLQIPRHDEARTGHGDTAHPAGPAEERMGPYRTITLVVTGMT